MSLKSEIDSAIALKKRRPNGIRLGLDEFLELEKQGYISRSNGGPSGLVAWAENVPFYSNDIYAWCDPSFNGRFELPEQPA
jgi:hypothetical protein